MRDTDDHPSRARLLAHLDGELSDGAAGRIAAHLEGCERCRRRRRELREASGLLRRALEKADVPAPGVDPREVRAAARETGASGREGAEATPGKTGARRLAGRAGLKAALVFLGLATAAAAALPGSPLRSWIAGAASSPEPAEADRAAAPAATARTSPQAVSIPVSGRAAVRIVDPAPGLVVRVRVVDGPRLTVTGRGGRYETGDGFLEVRAPGGGELRIDLPRSVRDARVTADGRLLLRREGGDLRIHAPVADSGEAGVTFALGDGAEER